MTLEEARELIGQRVTYRPRAGYDDGDGTIISVTRAYAFVLYDDQPRDGSPRATRAADLDVAS